jgi:acyl carrier protein
MSVEQHIRAYIRENFLFDDATHDLAGDASLLDRGLIDSTSVLEIILFIEQQFGIKMQDHEMLPENLDSVNNLVRFVESRLPAQ